MHKWKAAFTAFLLAVVGLIAVNQQTKALETSTTTATACVQSPDNAPTPPVINLEWYVTEPTQSIVDITKFNTSSCGAAINTIASAAQGSYGSGRHAMMPGTDFALTWWKTTSVPTFALQDIMRGDELNVFRTNSCTTAVIPNWMAMQVYTGTAPAVPNNSSATQARAAVLPSTLNIKSAPGVAQKLSTDVGTPTLAAVASLLNRAPVMRI